MKANVTIKPLKHGKGLTIFGVWEQTPRGDVQLASCLRHSDAVLVRDARRRETARPAPKRRRRRNHRDTEAQR